MRSERAAPTRLHRPAFSITKAKTKALKAPRVIKVGTDFSGMNTVLVSLARMLPANKCKFVFSSEILPERKRLQEVMLEDQPDIQCGDVTDRDIDKMPYVDVYVTTPPCQTFSRIGNKKGVSDDGDKRGNLIAVGVKYTVACKPRLMILENVKGLMSKKFQHIVKGIKKTLRVADYKVWVKVLNSRKYALAQTRERVFMVAIRGDSYSRKFKWPEPCPRRVSLTDILDPVVATDKPGRMPKTKTARANMTAGCRKAWDSGINPLTVPCAIDVDASKKFFTMGINEAKTVTRSRGLAGGPWITTRGRRTTPTELLKLQGFKETEVPWQKADVTASQLGAMLGNAVPVPVMGHVLSAAMLSAGITATRAPFPDPRP